MSTSTSKAADNSAEPGGTHNDAQSDRENATALMTQGFLDNHKNGPLNALSEMLTELQQSQELFIEQIGREQATFAKGPQKELGALQQTFDKVAAYQTKVHNLSQQMQQLKGRMHDLKGKSTTLHQSVSQECSASQENKMHTSTNDLQQAEHTERASAGDTYSSLAVSATINVQDATNTEVGGDSVASSSTQQNNKNGNKWGKKKKKTLVLDEGKLER